MRKTRRCITVDEDVASWADKQVEDGPYSSFSHAVNVALKELRKKGTVKL